MFAAGFGGWAAFLGPRELRDRYESNARDVRRLASVFLRQDCATYVLLVSTVVLVMML
jgi:hypothetical protein